MAFASGFRRVLAESATIIRSRFSSVRFNSTITSPKLFVSAIVASSRTITNVSLAVSCSRYHLRCSFVELQLSQTLEDFPCLSRLTTDEKLKEAFSRFGQLLEAKVVIDRATGRSKGFGFVTYSTIEDAEKAREEMNAKFLDGWVIFVDPAKPREPRPPPQPEPEPSETGFRTNKTIGWCG